MSQDKKTLVWPNGNQHTLSWSEWTELTNHMDDGTAKFQEWQQEEWYPSAFGNSNIIVTPYKKANSSFPVLPQEPLSSLIVSSKGFLHAAKPPLGHYCDKCWEYLDNDATSFRSIDPTIDYDKCEQCTRYGSYQNIPTNQYIPWTPDNFNFPTIPRPPTSVNYPDATIPILTGEPSICGARGIGSTGGTDCAACVFSALNYGTQKLRDAMGGVKDGITYDAIDKWLKDTKRPERLFGFDIDTKGASLNNIALTIEKAAHILMPKNTMMGIAINLTDKRGYPTLGHYTLLIHDETGKIWILEPQPDFIVACGIKLSVKDYLNHYRLRGDGNKIANIDFMITPERAAWFSKTAVNAGSKMYLKYIRPEQRRLGGKKTRTKKTRTKKTRTKKTRTKKTRAKKTRAKKTRAKKTHTKKHKKK